MICYVASNHVSSSYLSTPSHQQVSARSTCIMIGSLIFPSLVISLPCIPHIPRLQLWLSDPHIDLRLKTSRCGHSQRTWSMCKCNVAIHKSTTSRRKIHCYSSSQINAHLPHKTDGWKPPPNDYGKLQLHWKPPPNHWGKLPLHWKCGSNNISIPTYQHNVCQQSPRQDTQPTGCETSYSLPLMQPHAPSPSYQSCSCYMLFSTAPCTPYPIPPYQHLSQLSLHSTIVRKYAPLSSTVYNLLGQLTALFTVPIQPPHPLKIFTAGKM